MTNFPMRIYLLITNSCNLSCVMCIREERKENFINFEEFKKNFDREDTSNIELVITGGEPTLHPKFVEFVKYSSKKFKKVLIATNGTHNSYVEEIKDIKNLIFQISLDGDRETHNRIRGKESFDKILETVQKLEKYNLNYCIASVVGKYNYKEIDKLIPTLREYKKMKYWKISYEMPFGHAKGESIFSAEEWNEFVDSILRKVDFPLNIKKIFPLEIYEKNWDKVQRNKNNRCLNCGSGKNKFYIYPDFNVYPCTCLTDFCIGNLKTQTLSEIVSSEKNSCFYNYKLSPESYCNQCKYKEVCNGGCIGMSYNILGKLGMGDIRCPILKEKYGK